MQLTRLTELWQEFTDAPDLGREQVRSIAMMLGGRMATCDVTLLQEYREYFGEEKEYWKRQDKSQAHETVRSVLTTYDAAVRRCIENVETCPEGTVFSGFPQDQPNDDTFLTRHAGPYQRIYDRPQRILHQDEIDLVQAAQDVADETFHARQRHLIKLQETSEVFYRLEDLSQRFRAAFYSLSFMSEVAQTTLHGLMHIDYPDMYVKRPEIAVTLNFLKNAQPQHWDFGTQLECFKQGLKPYHMHQVLRELQINGQCKVTSENDAWPYALTQAGEEAFRMSQSHINDE